MRKKTIFNSYVLALTEESPCIWTLCIAFYCTQAQMQMLQKPDYELNVFCFTGAAVEPVPDKKPHLSLWHELHYLLDHTLFVFFVDDYCGALKAGDHFCH
jgi:hypothetical protein